MLMLIFLEDAVEPTQAATHGSDVHKRGPENAAVSGENRAASSLLGKVRLTPRDRRD